MTQRLPNDYDLTLPPFTVEEMDQVNAAIQAWHSAGANIPDAPLQALLTSVLQTLATARRLLEDLESPAFETFPVERKRKFLDNFREVLAIHAASTLDVTGLRAMGAEVRSDLEETGAEESEEATDWMKLEGLLGAKEDLMEVLMGKVDGLEELKGAVGEDEAREVAASEEADWEKVEKDEYTASSTESRSHSSEDSSYSF